MTLERVWKTSPKMRNMFMWNAIFGLHFLRYEIRLLEDFERMSTICRCSKPLRLSVVFGLQLATGYLTAPRAPRARATWSFEKVSVTQDLEQ